MLLKISQTKSVFLWILRNFQEHLFHRTSPVAASEKLKAEAVFRKCSVKKVFLEISQNSQENTCTKVSFLQLYACNFIKIKSLTQVFSCEFCKQLSLRTLFFGTPSVAASVKTCNFTKIGLCHGCFLWTF